MNKNIKIVSTNIDNIIKIRFNNILDGFDTYKNYTLQPENRDSSITCEETYIKFIRSCYKINKKVNPQSPLVIDFYLSKLNPEQYKSLLLMLSDEDQVILSSLYLNRSEYHNYYYVLDEDMLDFFVRLCTRELFFVTFYFIGYEATVWGNYNFKFPIFYDDEKVIQIYKEIADENKLLLL